MPSRFWKTVPSWSYGNGPPEWIRSSVSEASAGRELRSQEGIAVSCGTAYKVVGAGAAVAVLKPSRTEASTATTALRTLTDEVRMAWRLPGRTARRTSHLWLIGGL